MGFGYRSGELCRHDVCPPSGVGDNLGHRSTGSPSKTRSVSSEMGGRNDTFARLPIWRQRPIALFVQNAFFSAALYGNQWVSLTRQEPAPCIVPKACMRVLRSLAYIRWCAFSLCELRRPSFRALSARGRKKTSLKKVRVWGRDKSCECVTVVG